MTSKSNSKNKSPNATVNEEVVESVPDTNSVAAPTPTIGSHMGKRYKLAYTKLFLSQPRWKQVAIDEDIKNGNKNGCEIMPDFIRAVIALAEGEEEILLTC
jgi:hypothetical protein